MLTLDMQGIPELQRRLQRLALQAEQALVQALQAEAERILEASYPLVPVDTGLLLSSGMTEARSDGADIRYGGHGIAPYALVVHERTDTNHPHGGQHHYLSQVVLEATGDMPQRLAAAMAPNLK